MAAPDPERYQRALDALAAGARGAGSPLIDTTAESAKAPVRERALKLLDQRARSREELSRRLQRAGFEAGVVAEVVTDLEACGLVDDQEFANEWVRQRATRLNKSSRVLDRELAHKGVGERQRAAALEQIDPEEEEARAVALAEKKAAAIHRVPQNRTERDKALRRIVGTLARRGYPQATAIQTAKTALDQRLAELREQLAAEPDGPEN